MPTFPNARYHFSARERAWFTDPANHSDRNRNSFLLQPDSIAPVIEAGQAEMIAIDGPEVVEGLSFHPTPGHSPDHASIRLRWALEQAADNDAVVFTTHFPASSVGRVTRDGAGFRWAFL